MIRTDGTGDNEKGWNDYRNTSITPTGWHDILDFEQTCNADTVGLAVIKYTLNPYVTFYYGWLDAKFPAEYNGTAYDVFTCTAE